MQLFGKLETQATKENIRNMFHGIGKLSKENRIEEEKPISKTLEKILGYQKQKKKKEEKNEATSLKITEEREPISITIWYYI